MSDDARRAAAWARSASLAAIEAKSGAFNEPLSESLQARFDAARALLAYSRASAAACWRSWAAAAYLALRAADWANCASWWAICRLSRTSYWLTGLVEETYVVSSQR